MNFLISLVVGVGSSLIAANIEKREAEKEEKVKKVLFMVFITFLGVFFLERGLKNKK